MVSLVEGECEGDRLQNNFVWTTCLTVVANCMLVLPGKQSNRL